MVAEKLIAFPDAAERLCKCSQALPYFVSQSRRMFTAEDVREHLAWIENTRLQRAMEAMDCHDPELENLADADAGPLTANLPSIVGGKCWQRRLPDVGADGFTS